MGLPVCSAIGFGGSKLSATRNGRNQKHFIAVFEAVLQASQEANVLIVDVNIQKALQLAVFRAKHLFEAGILLVKAIDKFTEVLRRGFNGLSAFGKLS